MKATGWRPWRRPRPPSGVPASPPCASVPEASGDDWRFCPGRGGPASGPSSRFPRRRDPSFLARCNPHAMVVTSLPIRQPGSFVPFPCPRAPRVSGLRQPLPVQRVGGYNHPDSEGQSPPGPDSPGNPMPQPTESTIRRTMPGQMDFSSHHVAARCARTPGGKGCPRRNGVDCEGVDDLATPCFPPRLSVSSVLRMARGGKVTCRSWLHMLPPTSRVCRGG